MKDKRIFLTGGTGFFGKSIFLHCNELKQNDVVVLSRNPDEFTAKCPWVLSNKRIKMLRGDVRDFKFPDADFDYIYHGATTSSRIIPDEEMRSVVIEGTEHVLDFARRNKRLSGFLFVSSGAVYGNKYSVPMKEDFACDPVAVYGQAKLAAEKLCLEADIPCNIARAFAFVGEYLPLNAHFAMGNFIRDCLNNKPIIIKGDGTAIRSYLYAGDLAHWLWTILLRGEPGLAYNVGSDQMISIGKLAETVRNVAGAKNEIQILQTPSGAPPQCYVPDISRARRELGLDVRTSLEEAIRKTLEFHRTRECR